MKRLWLILFVISCTTAQNNYEGELNDDGIYHGKGVITYPNGEKWEGEFKDGEPYNGYGVYNYLNGDKYVGEYEYGLPNGQGTYSRYSNIYGLVDSYVGEWKGGNYNGLGTKTYEDGQKYVGEWKDGIKDGQGTENYSNGNKYVGRYKYGLPNGQGTFTFSNGEKYVGRFIDGLYDSKDINFSVPGISSPKNYITELPPPPETLTNIAVVDFNGNNISDGVVRALTDRLRAELFKTKHFKVIEREMMQEVLKEQGLQQSGCTTDECMVEIGRLIGVEKIIGGSISKVGHVYSVASRIVNVETGEIEKSEVYDHVGEIGQLLTNGMRMVAIGLIK